MSSYMGPGKVLKKIVDEFNRSMGTKFKIDNDSFVKGSVTGIELREGTLFSEFINEEKMTKKHAKIASTLLAQTSVESVVPHKDILFVNYTKYTERRKIIKQLEKLFKYDGDGRMTNAPRGISGVGGTNWIAFKSRHTSEAKLDKEKFTEPEDMRMHEGKPFPMDTPNEFAYLDFKKWVYKNRTAVKNILIKALKDNRGDGTYLFLALTQVWLAWANKKAKQWTGIPVTPVGKKDFGRALAVMMKKDNLVISKSGNKLSDIK
tara:strand:- start:63 stop:848 length:786 start_codon:yes stop_codon:yes gene_type:complete